MRKIALASLLLAAVPVAAGAEELSVIVSGKYHDPLSAYKVGSTYYLNAKEAGGLYGAQVYWFPVSGRIQMTAHGRSLQLLANSDAAKDGSKEIKLETAVMLRTSQAYIPLSFFEGDDFSSWAGADTVFNPRTKLLTVDRRSSVGPIRWFSYGDYTRITVEISPRFGFSAAARGLGGLELAIPFGVVDASERAEIGDGVVAYYSLTQGAKAAKVGVKFAGQGTQWRVKELANPRRLAIDIFKGAAFDTPGDVPVTAKAAPTARAPQTEAAPQPKKEAPTKPSIGPVVMGAGASVKRRVVIDAGHGGKDPGASGHRGTLEKDINLIAAQDLARLLKEEGAFEVLLTRADDTFIPLADRSRMADEFRADLFISLHSNASRNARDSGFEVYFLSERATDPEAERLAEFENSVLELEGKLPQDEQADKLLKELSKTENINAGSELAALMAREISKRVDLENRGVKQAAFYVLRGTHAPAVLFEMAYITNAKDEVKLESKKFRRRLVDGLYAGVLEYAKRQGWMAAQN